MKDLKKPVLYPYKVYVQIIQEMLDEKPVPAQLPSLEQFLKIFKLVASKEIAMVYDMSITEVEKELKKWVLQQKVRVIKGKYGTFWSYIDKETKNRLSLIIKAQVLWLVSTSKLFQEG